MKRETVILEPENKPENAKQIGVDATETLEYSEATLFVNRIERPKYVVKDTEGVLMHPMPERALGRSMFGNSFAAQAIVSKFVDHQPEYRQMQALKRQDIHVPSSSFNDIFSTVANALVGVYESCSNEVFSSSYIQADETPNRVMTNEKKGKCHQGYYWAYRSPEKNMVFFDYREGRSGEGPRDKLKNFKGRLQCDGFSVYHALCATFRHNPSLADQFSFSALPGQLTFRLRLLRLQKQALCQCSICGRSILQSVCPNDLY